MGFNTKLQDADALDIFGSALANAESKPAIAQSMADIGYDSNTLEEGKKLLDGAKAAFQAYLLKRGGALERSRMILFLKGMPCRTALNWIARRQDWYVVRIPGKWTPWVFP
jgi:hypothetical protein